LSCGFARVTGSPTDFNSVNIRSPNVPYEWPETKDHAKEAISIKDNAEWVCVADINRQLSQAKRGGAICFYHPALWPT
jgi:deoxyribonuclease-2